MSTEEEFCVWECELCSYVYDEAKGAPEDGLAPGTRWKDVPAPHRGELVRRYGALVREKKEVLSRLLTIENGKILTEARGEVQEVIDICEYAVGLSRQLFGLTIASERAEHRLTPAPGGAGAPWLPASLVSRLARHDPRAKLAPV